jgi:hypothetical protein
MKDMRSVCVAEDFWMIRAQVDLSIPLFTFTKIWADIKQQIAKHRTNAHDERIKIFRTCPEMQRTASGTCPDTLVTVITDTALIRNREKLWMLGEDIAYIAKDYRHEYQSIMNTIRPIYPSIHDSQIINQYPWIEPQGVTVSFDNMKKIAYMKPDTIVTESAWSLIRKMIPFDSNKRITWPTDTSELAEKYG